MSQLEFVINNCKELYEETGDNSWEVQLNKEKDRYKTIKAIVDILYN